jgi:sugar phosphate isomerase/epimerase
MAKIPIGLQLNSVRKDCEQDLPAVLQAVAKMGYEGVEFAGYYGRSAEELRKMLDDLGLKCCGTHTGLNTILGDELPRTIAFNQTLGNKYLIVPGLPEERRNSPAAWRETARLMNEAAERSARDGMLVGYHNHHIEFVPMQGELPWDIFFGSTKPEVVMQFDTGNALHGGAETAPFLKRYPNRAKTVHLKEYSKTNDKALIGEGDVPWPEIFQLCETVGGTEWYIVEQESYAYPPLECVDRCLQKLREMGK